MARNTRSGGGSRPIYNVRAKTGRKDGDKDVFMTCGAAWAFNSGDGLNVKIDALPVNFDGYLMLVPPPQDE